MSEETKNEKTSVELNVSIELKCGPFSYGTCKSLFKSARTFKGDFPDGQGVPEALAKLVKTCSSEMTKQVKSHYPNVPDEESV